MSPVRIQLAVQGGGAKLCGLLAAMEAIRQLEQDEVLEVTRLAGTSAGAIAAALYATGADFGAIRRRLIEHRAAVLKLAPVPHWTIMLARFLCGRPVVRLAPLRALLKQELKNPASKTDFTFESLALPLIVVATDLTGRQTRTYSRAENAGNSVAEAVEDSMAIPGFFRAYGKAESGKLVVDGGICENFPVEALQEGQEEFGPIFGVGFEPQTSGETPSTPVAFARSILESSIDNSVRRAQRLLGRDRMCTLATDIGTFEFKRALNEGLGKAYDDWVKATTTFFSDALVDGTPVTGRVLQTAAQPDESATVMQRAADLYRAQHAHVKMRYTEIRMVIRLGALTEVHQAGEKSPRSLPDLMLYRLEFTADHEPLACARVAVIQDSTSTTLRTFRKAVFDKNGNEIRTIDLLAVDRKAPDRKAYLLFFDPVLQPNDPNAPYTLEYAQEVEGAMAPLAQTGSDTLAVWTNRAAGVTPKVVLVALVPRTHPHVEMVAEDSPTSRVVGRTMTTAELRLLPGISIEGDYYPVGWMGENVEAGARFAARIVRRS